MFLKTCFGVAALTFLCLPQLATAQGNLVVNGGFDTSATGWTLAGGAYYNVKNGNPPGDVVLLGLIASALQTIDGLTTGATYTVSGYYQDQDAVGMSAPDPTVEVTMNGSVLFELAAFTDDNWDKFSFLYTASSSDAVLSIDAFNGPGGSSSIDNIAMEAIPEPSASVLIILGGGVFFYAYARKRECLCF